MQTLNEFFCVNDALRFNLVDVSLEHGLKGRTKRLLRELKRGEDIFHFCNRDSTTPLRVCLLQRVVQLQLLHVHLRDVDRV